MLYRTVQAFEEAAQPDPFAEVNEDEDEETPLPCAPLHFYLALRAADIFNVEYSRWPGSGNEDQDPNGQKDVDECLACAERVMQSCTGNEEAIVDAALDRAVKEMWVNLVSHDQSRRRRLTGYTIQC